VKQVQERIRDLIRTHGSVRAVGRACGITHTYLRCLLNGTLKNPSAKVLSKLGLPVELEKTGPSAAPWATDPDGVEWRAVPAYEGLYEVSNMGHLRSVPRLRSFGDHQRQVGGNVLRRKPRKGDGYIRVVLYRGEEREEHPLHRLVLEAFVGPCPSGMEACHNNGIRADCRLSNLRWDTRSGNSNDKHAHGTMVRGEAFHSAKLTEAQVQAIRVDGRLHTDIAAEYQIERRQVSQIKRRKSWAWLP